jgi:hypothetical protein
MREAQYFIVKGECTGVYRGDRPSRLCAIPDDVHEALAKISVACFDGSVGSTYILPRAKTAVSVNVSDDDILLNIRTTRWRRVERSLRKFLDKYDASYVSGDQGMIKEHHMADDDDI